MNIKILFIIASFEKFSFNGIRSLLIVYLITHLHLIDEIAYKKYAAIMALAFLMPMICGYLTDKWLCAQNSLIFSSAWSGIGLLLLCFHNLYLFDISIAALIVGSAFIKTIIPSLIGEYAKNQQVSQDALYSKLYVYFNLGSLLGTICCSMLGEALGWNYGFIVAALVMFLSSFLTIFKLKVKINNFNFYSFVIINIAICALFTLCFLLLSIPVVISPFLIISLLSGLGFLYWTVLKNDILKLRNICLLIFLMILHTIFFALYEQGSLSLVLFTERFVDRSFSAFFPINSTIKIPATFFQVIDPIVNIFLGTFFVYFWQYLSEKKVYSSYVSKFSLGLVIIALGFIFLGFFPHNSLLSPWSITLVYIIFVIGEQCVIPIGFSAVNNLAPKSFMTFCMGLWFIAISISEWLAEIVSHFLTPLQNQKFIIESYQTKFIILGTGIIVLTIFLYIFHQFLFHNKRNYVLNSANVAAF